MLPTMSGIAVLNAVRKTSQIPVIMLTALEDEYTQVSSFDCYDDDTIYTTHDIFWKLSNQLQFLMETFVIIFTVIMASLPVGRMKPKDILSKMSWQEDKNHEYMEKSIFIYSTEKSKNGYFSSFAFGNVHIYLNWTVYL